MFESLELPNGYSYGHSIFEHYILHHFYVVKYSFMVQCPNFTAWFEIHQCGFVSEANQAITVGCNEKQSTVIAKKAKPE